MSSLDERRRILATVFRDVFDCRGRLFGRPSGGVIGISDGADGVQWNAGYDGGAETYWLGVNLEGMKYDGWPVARLIEREISHPRLLTEYRAKVARPETVTVSWYRDAWQVRTRFVTDLTPTPLALSRLDAGGWRMALEGAYECLDPNRQYRGRRRTAVTLPGSGERVERWVSPHFTLWSTFDLRFGSADGLVRAKDNLEPLYEFVRRQALP